MEVDERDLAVEGAREPDAGVEHVLRAELVAADEMGLEAAGRGAVEESTCFFVDTVRSDSMRARPHVMGANGRLIG
jgi:hypothetical protein